MHFEPINSKKFCSGNVGKELNQLISLMNKEEDDQKKN